MLVRAFLLLGLLLPLAAPAAQDASAEVSLYVLQDGAPVPGLSLWLDEQPLGRTDADGAVLAPVAPGEHALELRNGDILLYTQRISVAENDFLQLIVTLKGKGRVAADVEGGDEVTGPSEELAAEVDPGRLIGGVISAEDGKPVAGARVFISGWSETATTDEDGEFAIELAPGNYAISVVHPKYTTRTLSNIVIAANQTHSEPLELTPAGLELAEFVVVAPYIEGSVASVLAEQREASSVIDVLGAEQMSRAGDSNAADALARVTGLTIEDGKFVVVRGAPSRYTMTLFNGSRLPSPDPIKRIVPLDLFPTGVLSSISVAKGYDAALPGAFGAGLINLSTTGVPDKPFLTLSAKTGANTQSTGEDGLDYTGGGDDALGVDDGTRALPGQLARALGGTGSFQDLAEGAGQLSNFWQIRDETLPVDMGLGLGAGSRADFLGGNFGVNGSLSWSNKHRLQERVARTFALAGDGTLALRNDKIERRSDYSIDIGGLLGVRQEWERHALASNSFFIRKTQQRAEITEGFDATSDDRFAREFLLEWNERELFLQQFVGEHEFDFFKLDWRAMLAESTRNSPDRREYIYRRQRNGEQFVFFRQNGASRRWDDSDDQVLNFDVDLLVPLLVNDRVTLSAGGGFSTYTQERESRTRRVSFAIEPGQDLQAEPEVLLDPAGIGEALRVSDQTQDNDNYLGDASVDAAYLKADFDWLKKLRIVAGLRVEQADFLVRTFVAGGSAGGQQVSGDFETTDVLPSLSLTWRFLEDMQLRGSYGRSVSRPVLNELSPARYFDPDTGDEFLGNPDLEPTEIDAFDLRWEWYPSTQETLSVGAFFKDYTNPIEQSFTGVGGSNPLRTNQNADSAEVVGVELAARSSFDRMLAPAGLDWDWLGRVYLQANFALVDSEVTLARQNLETNVNRTLQGQADQTLNVQLGYDGERQDWTLSLNRVGERLRLTGIQGQPDVFQEPITLLDFKYSLAVTEGLKLETSLGNLLDSEVEWLQGGRQFRAFKPGIDAGLSVKYSF